MADNLPGRHTHLEILSQPEAWRAALDGLARSASPQLPDPSRYDQVLFIGCGSTHYLSIWAAHQCQVLCGVTSRAAPASDLFLFPSAWLRRGRKTLLVAVSRSAETTETLRAVEAYRAGGYGDIVAIACYPDGRLTQLTPWAVDTPAGQERSVAQTRSFTCMMLAVAWLLQAERPPRLAAILAERAQWLLDEYRGLTWTLTQDGRFEHFFFLGSGPLFGLACEAMLKMKEMSLCYSEAYHFLEFRHGPMSMLDSRALVVGLLSQQAWEQELAVLADMRALGAHTLAVGEGGNGCVSPAVGWMVKLGSDLPPIWRAPLYLPVLQLLAYHQALAKGLDPDRPRHLEAVVRLDM